MRRSWLAVLLLVTGCASAPIKKQDLPALANADALVLEGCYHCLLEARKTYERIGVRKARPLVLVRLFETQLLIVLREKELALAATPALDHARELAREMPVEAEAGRYLALVEAVPPDSVGTPRWQIREFQQAHVPFARVVRDELTWLRTATALREPVRRYLSLAVDCAYPARSGRTLVGTAFGDGWTGSVRAMDLPDAPPLVVYRAATCQVLSVPALQRVRASVPRFVEAALFLGRAEVFSSSNTGSGKARDLLAEARAHFPESPAVTYLSGNVSQLGGDCRAALDFYDQTLARVPVHEDALLGRTACLSYLQRNAEAILAATRMIEFRTDNWGQAYYWRAWNHHFLKRLELARADIERAKTLAVSEQTFTLAGIVAYDQHDFPAAEPDLIRAKALNRARRNCTAMWYLGLVTLDQERWLESAGHFEGATGCYRLNVVDDEAAIRRMEALPDLDPDFRARQIAGFQAALKEDRSQLHAAAFNAANQFARAGHVEKARVLLDVAAADPALAAPVGQLREILKSR